MFYRLSHHTAVNPTKTYHYSFFMGETLGSDTRDVLWCDITKRINMWIKTIPCEVEDLIINN